MTSPDEIIWKDEELVLWRPTTAERPASLLQAPIAAHPSAATLLRLERAYQLRAELDPTWAVVPRALLGREQRATLVLDDPGGLLLAHVVGRCAEPAQFLRIAIGLATSLHKLHECRLIHRDVRPSNLFADVTTGQVWLAGFGLCARLLALGDDGAGVEAVAGGAPYLAPEQSGRINRPIDQRSDLYSVGVTLYELWSGRLPFSAQAPADWAYAHVARSPAPLEGPGRAIPAQLSALIMKLLAKTADERYQTAVGLEADLRICLERWKTHGRIEPFVLGSRDALRQLEKPKRLYGRGAELESLVASHHRVATSGAPEVAIVSGRSGSGKSVLVAELLRGLSPESSLFGSGKFDQLNQGIPYATLGAALGAVIRQLLRKGDAEVASYRSALLAALGDSCQPLLDLIPELAALLSPRLPAAAVAAEEAQARFRQMMLRLFAALSRPARPLVLFLDDLQWADRATLDLLLDFTRSADAHHFLLMGAYRDEGGGDQPLWPLVEQWRENQTTLVEIALGPLSESAVTELVADALRLELAESRPLAQALLAKTGGNPLLLVQFMTALVDDGFLAFDVGAATWRWDLPRILGAVYADNLSDLMVAKLKRLPDVTREMLKLLACLGDSSALALVAGSSEADAQRRLAPAVTDGLVARVDGARYRFVHDRLQEAAYALIHVADRAATHLRIAQRLSTGLPDDARDQSLFEIANHFLRGAARIESSAQRLEVAALTLAAARRALAANAYATATGYLSAGEALLPDDAWERHYELTFALGLVHAECELSSGEPLAGERRLRALAARAGSSVDDARVTCRRADLYLRLDRRQESLDVCLEHLQRVGFALAPRPSAELYLQLQASLAGRPIAGLIELPAMTAEPSLSTMEVLQALLPAAELLESPVHDLAVLRMALLSVAEGQCAASAIAFAELGRLLIARFGDRANGVAFGLLALALADRHGHPRVRGRVYHLVAGHVMPWSEPMDKAKTLMRRAYELALDAGDLLSAGASQLQLVSLSLAASEPLQNTQRQIEEALRFGREKGVALIVPYLTKLRRLVEELCESDSTSAPFEPLLEGELAFPRARCWLWLRRLSRCVVAGDDVGARAALSAAEAAMFADHSFYEWAEYRFYAALAHAAAGHLDLVVAHGAELTAWAAVCPANFAARATLVAAEVARLEGRTLDAEPLYERAIDAARAHCRTLEEALANERAASFYAERHLLRCARSFRSDARDAYQRWGADGKARALAASDGVVASVEIIAPATSAERFDLAAVLELSKAIAGELVLDRLVERLLTIVLEHAGASRGLLILRTRDGFRAEAEALAGTNAVTVRMIQAALSPADLPDSIFRQVERTQQAVCLDDASRPGPFASDHYFAGRRARSLLCLPLVKQTELIGVLYLENELTTHAFAAGCLAILSVLASHAAIALENARLYAELKRADLHLAEAQSLSHTGSFSWNLRDNSTSWSDEARRIYGFARDTRQTADDVLRIIHPEDRERTAKLVDVLNKEGDHFVNEFRVVLADGTLKHVRVVGHAVQSEAGHEYVGAIMDITAAKQAEADLQRAHLYLAEAQRLSHTGSICWNIATGDSFWSEETYAIYGYEYGTKATAERVLQRIHPEDLERVTRQVEQVTREGKDWISEFRMVLPDGVVKHVQVVARVSAWERGNREYIGAIRDVTAERLAEERVRASQRRYAVTLSSIGDGVIATDEAGHITFLNPVAEAMTGVANSQGLGRPLDEVFPIGAESGHPTLLARDGRRIPIDERRSPIVDEGGEPTGVVIVFHDVTQRRLAEEAAALQLMNERLQLALRGSNVGIWDFALRDEKIAEAPSHMVNMWESLGYPRDDPEESRGVHAERWHAGDLEQFYAAIDANIRGATPDFGIVARNVHSDGSHRWRIHRGVVLRDAEQRAVRFIGSSVDITDRKQLEDELLHAKELAVAANQAKDAFLANVSHEIRTPMNAVFGMTELMLEEPLTELQRQRLSIVKSAADSLIVIIDDLLDFSKIEAGKIELELADFSLRRRVGECLQTLAGRARDKGIALVSAIDDDVPDRLLGDAGRVRQILINLVGNAIKFTVEGEVSVRVQRAMEDARGVGLRFLVRDTGIGISADKQASIFQAFTQADSSTTRTYGGTGLGLTIAARLAEAMAGGITVVSEEGHGSRFTFSAWFARPGDGDADSSSPVTAALGSPAPTAASTKRRILVAEDNDFNAELIRQLLGRRGHAAVVVNRGDEVLARIEESRFDLLLLDLHMPGLDGFDVVARIRTREKTTGEHLPVVALTARSRKEDRERCFASGMDDFLSKPIRAAALWSAIDRLTRDADGGDRS